MGDENIVKIPVASHLSRQARLEYIIREWRDMLWLQRIDPFYSNSSLYRHEVVEAEY